MALVDQKTPRLGLLLPFTDNFLQDDVERLRDTLNLLDVLVVTRDKTTGKIADDMLSDVIAKLDANGKLNKANLPSTVVQTGPDGKIDGSLMPSIAVIDTFPVPNEASMLGLQCERGDIAIREDLGKTFILTQMPPSVLSNWRELTSTNVTSVNGKTGAVTGLAASGANNDITSLNALSGPLRLGGDAVGDYDAVTMRQLRSASGGAGGPSMNGVMNYGVGDFHLRDSRAYIQPYEVVADGQLLNRADWPELWAYAQMLTPIADADWLADPTKRGKYSLGNGSTTFRVPDRNGVQTGSIQALFGRGDGGNSSINGEIRQAHIPNITAQAVLHGAGGANIISSASGAFIAGGGDPTSYRTPIDLTPKSGADSYGTFAFNAARSNPVYGRYPAITDEVLPRHFTGVWVIRASGGFVAANTSWSVINADAVRPGSGVKASSGQVKAQYKIGTEVEAEAGLRSDAYIDGLYYAILSVYNRTKGVTKALAFDDTGTLSSDRYAARFGSLMAWNETGTRKGTFTIENQSLGANYAFNSMISAGQSVSAGYYTATHFGMIHNDGGSFAQSCWQVVGDENNGYGCRLAIQPNSDNILFYRWVPGNTATYTIAKNAISDANLKHDIAPVSVDKSWANLQGLEFVTFVYNNDEQERVRRGVIAQQAETVEPLYVKTREFYDNNHVKRSQKELDTHPMLLDTMHVVQTLMLKIETMEAEIAELKASK